MADRIRIQTRDGRVVAIVKVTNAQGPTHSAGKYIGDRYWGTLQESRFPDSLAGALQEYQDLIDEGVISLHDQALANVLAHELVAVREPEADEWRIVDLQVSAAQRAVVIALSR